jgi:hypothetical protein
MKPPSKQFLIKLAERMLWTGLQSAVAFLIVSIDSFGIPTVYLPLIAVGLAGVKGMVARHVGDPESPATLPAGV